MQRLGPAFSWWRIGAQAGLLAGIGLAFVGGGSGGGGSGADEGCGCMTEDGRGRGGLGGALLVLGVAGVLRRRRA